MVNDIAKYNLAGRRVSYCDRGGRGLSREEGLCVPLSRILCDVDRIWRNGFGNQGLLEIFLSSSEKRREHGKELQPYMLAPVLYSLCMSVFPRSMSVHHMYAQYLQEPGERAGSLGSGVKSGGELPTMWVLGTEPGSSARAKGLSLQTHAAGTFYEEEPMNEQVAKVRPRERISLGDFF